MQGDTAVLKKEGEWRNNKVAMPARCREDLEDDNMSAGIAMSRKTEPLL